MRSTSTPPRCRSGYEIDIYLPEESTTTATAAPGTSTHGAGAGGGAGGGLAVEVDGPTHFTLCRCAALSALRDMVGLACRLASKEEGAVGWVWRPCPAALSTVSLDASYFRTFSGALVPYTCFKGNPEPVNRAD